MYKIKLILLFFVVSLGVMGQDLGVIDGDTAKLPPRSGISRLSLRTDKLYFRGFTGTKKEVVSTNNIYSNPQWLTSIDATRLGNGTVNNTKLGYLSGVTSDIQTQLNNTSSNATHSNRSVLDATTASYTTAEQSKLAALPTNATLQNNLDGKVDKVAGKQLSTNDYTTAEQTKLASVQSGATANSTDAQLRDRTTHTGVQAISTVSGLQTALDSKEAALGNPASNGFVLSSNTNGTRSWIAPPGVSWGAISGNLTNQQDLRDTLFYKYLKADGYVENKYNAIHFLGELYRYHQVSQRNIGIAWYGDSVSPHVSGETFMNLGNRYPLNNLNYPAGIRSSLGLTLTGVVKYGVKNPGEGSQTNLNGILSCTITRSGSTATLTTSTAHFLDVGEYVTITGADQSEYNGTFLVTARTTTTASFTVTGTPTSPATGSITCYGGIQDFTYLPSASHIELANAATAFYTTGQNGGYSTFRVFFATDNTSGSALVELLQEDGTTVVTSQNVNLNSGSLTATHIDLAAVDPNLKHRVRVTATGKVVILAVYPLRTFGLTSVNFGLGGTTFTQNNYSSNAILDYMMTNLNVKLIFVQAKEENAPSSLTPLATRLNRYSQVSKFIIGSLPDSQGDAGGALATTNSQFKTMAFSNNYVFFDGYKLFNSAYANLVSAGLQGDGTHPADYANQFAADQICTELNLLNQRFSKVTGGIDQTFTSGTITGNNVLNNIYITSPAIVNPIKAISSVGGSNVKQLLYENAQEVRFQNNNTYPIVSGYTDSGIGIFQRTGTGTATFGNLYARSIITQTSIASNFDGLNILGNNANTTINLTTVGQQLGITTNGGGIRINASGGTNNDLYVTSAGRIGIGTNSPVSSSLIDMRSTTQGVLLPRMTTSQRNAIPSPVAGLMLYDTDLLRLVTYDGTNWGTVGVLSGGASQALSSGTTITVTIGTTMPNTTYRVGVTPTSALGVSGYVTNKTTTTFDYILTSPVTGTVTFDWEIFR